MMRSFSTTISKKAVIERRQYKLKPEKISQFLECTQANIELRNKLVPLRLFCFPDSGSALNVANHFYYYENGIVSRDESRSKAALDGEWQDYLKLSRPCSLEQWSELYVEADLDGACGMKTQSIISADKSSSIYEIRTYSLHLGYHIVPKFLQHYSHGLVSKLSAPGTDPSTQLCSILYTEVGMLNNVIEIWRHGGGTKAMEISRSAARSALHWRKAIDDIATITNSFNTTIYRPTPFSNWK